MNINILSSNIKSVEFENIEVYRTIPHRDLKTNLNMVLNKIKNKIGIIFFSPSGFHAILDLIPNELLSQVHVSINNLNSYLYLVVTFILIHKFIIHKFLLRS